MKVRLHRPHGPHDPNRVWVGSVPFFWNPRGHLIHRVKAAETFASCRSKDTHLAYYWCGNRQVSRTSKSWVEYPVQDAIVCAKCEAMAVAAGERTSNELVGRHVHIGSMKIKCFCHPEMSKLVEESRESLL